MPDYKLTHQPCDDCGSSDALCINYDESTFCHSCRKYTHPPLEGSEIAVRVPEKPLTGSEGFEATLALLATETFSSVPERGLSAATMKSYGVVVKSGQVIYPYYEPTEPTSPVAAKVRYPDKRFQTSGDWSKGGLFGQQLFPKSGKYVTLTEGEYDALAAYQMMGSKYPVVSIKNGASSALKDCKASYEWLDSFETIVICFDADEQGLKAADEVGQLFGGKAKIVKHVNSYKDACDYLVNNDVATFNNAFWRAEKYVPDGIVNAASLWEEVNTPMETAEVAYPFKGINELTYGIRPAELVTVTAGSGLGKSQFLREVVWATLQQTVYNIGLLFLEESIRKTALSIMSLAANKQLHLPTVQSTEEERREAFDATLADERLYLLDHFGSTDVDNIVGRVRYMAKALDCRYVFLDHVSIVVSAQSNLDERKALDEIMTKLRMLVQETGIALFVVSHLRRPDNKGHEEGAATSLSQLRGSASIAQLSDIVLGLERDGQADDIIVRNTTAVRVLKNRFSGETGRCADLYFDSSTGRMVESTLEDAL
jgi:twinkle protein